MSVLTVRGGIPHVFRQAGIDAITGRYHQFPAISNYIKLTTGLKPVKMYFTEADFTADENYIGPESQWEGPVESQGIWFRCGSAAPDTSEVVLVVFLRRG